MYYNNNFEKRKMNGNKPALSTNAMATILNVHQRTLIIYDNLGLLCPKRSDKNRRKYSLNDIKKGEAILFLTRNLLVNLAGVKIIFTLLEKYNIEIEDYLNYINELAKSLNIGTKTQRDNITKMSKRGRPKGN